MLESYPWLSLVPPLVAVIIALKLKKVFAALFLGLWIGSAFIANGNPVEGFFGAIDRCLDVLKDKDSLRVILFCCFIGAVMAFSQRSGGIEGFMNCVSKRSIADSRRKAQFLTVAISALIPVESSINILVPGTISRPLFDKLLISRQKLAFLCLSFCAPICTIFPVNAWGAYISGILGSAGIPHPFRTYLKSIPMNLYAIFAILFALLLIITQKDVLAMAKAEKRAGQRAGLPPAALSSFVSREAFTLEAKTGVVPHASNMLVPVGAMFVLTIASMLITGRGRFAEGLGATSVFYGVLGAIIIAALKYRWTNIMRFDEILDLFLKAVGGMTGLGLLLVFSFALSRLCVDIKTGAFVAGAAGPIIGPKFAPAILFAVTGFVAFATGTSWGTWAIMLPIGLGFARGNTPVASLIIGAVVSGGVFANHCSPFASEPIIASLVTENDHIDNMKTVLPYSLIVAGFTAVSFLLIGLIYY